MSATDPLRRLPFHLALTVIVSGFVTLWICSAYDFSTAKALVAWIGTVVFCGLVVIGGTFLVAKLDREEKEFYRSGQKKAQ